MFTIHSDNDSGSTLVPNLFIDQYMRDANDAQLKVYLFLLRRMEAGGTTSISDMADQFNHTEKEVLRSLRYWEKCGLLTVEYGENNEPAGVHLEALYPHTSDTGRHDGHSNPPADSGSRGTGIQGLTLPGHRDESADSEALSSSPAADREATQGTASGHHTAGEAQLEEFRSNKKRAQLLFVIEQYIGKPLSPGEVQSVYYISEELHFSDALIDYLLQYCIDRGKKDFRYIEKVAVNWAEHGISTPKQAERAVSPLRKNRRSQNGVRPSANKFNQFEQNHYNFDELEREILGS